MIRILFIAAAAALWTACAHAQVLRSTPKIVCDNPVWDFGTVDNTEVLKHTFIVRNQGTGELVLSNLKPSCGCTVAKVSNKNLEPGEEAKIDAVLNLKGKKGKRSMRIDVSSNDVNKPLLTLTMVGTAMPLILAEPFMLNFGNVEPGAAVVRQKVVVTAREGKSFKISRVDSARSSLDLEWKILEEGRKYEVYAAPKETSKQGRFFDQIRIHTDLGELPVLDVSVSGKVIGPIEIIPESLYLTPRGNRPIPPRYVMLAPGTLKKEFKISKVEWPGENVASSILPLNSTAGFRGFRVILKNIVPTPDLNGKKLVIHTDVPGMETIEVPLVVRKPLTSLQKKP